jgi:hypothetical protein
MRFNTFNLPPIIILCTVTLCCQQYFLGFCISMVRKIIVTPLFKQDDILTEWTHRLWYVSEFNFIF